LTAKLLVTHTSRQKIRSGVNMSDDSEKEIIFNELTSDIRPDLGMYGIEEVDRGICEDSYENRSILRTHRMNWNNVFDENGQPTGLIQILSPEMRAAKTRSTLEDRKALLTDDRDFNSDYLTEEALIIEEAADTLAPLWVIAQTRTWIRVREARKKDPKRMAQLEGPPTRCRYIKTDGIRCMLWCSGRISDDGLCRTHLGTRSNNVTGAVAKARQRAYQAAPAALAMLEQLMESAESEPVKLKAATEILDRAGIRGGVEIDAKVEVNARPAEEQIRERLMRLAPRLLTPDPEDDILEIETDTTDD
jgi:hypothetical protein